MTNDCPGSIEVTYDMLPFVDSWCTEQPIVSEDSIQQQNPNGILDPEYGCWHCLSLPRWYTFSSGQFGGQISLEAHFDLCGNFGNCGNMVGYYSVFDDCPENGGKILSYPCNCYNESGECWDEFSGNDNFVASSCWEDGCCSWPNGIYCYPSGTAMTPFDVDEVSQGEPPWNFPVTDYWITWNLEPFTTYYLVIHGTSSCGSQFAGPTYTWGCISIVLDGLNVLDLEEGNGDSHHNVESPQRTKRLKYITDINSRVIEFPEAGGLYLYYYDDGTVDKRVIIR